MATEVEVKPLVGKMREASTGKVISVKWNDIERVFLNGRQIATINKQPGAKIALLAGVMLTAEQKAAVSKAIAAKRGGVAPAGIDTPMELPYELVDDEPEAEVDEADDE